MNKYSRHHFPTIVALISIFLSGCTTTTNNGLQKQRPAPPVASKTPRINKAPKPRSPIKFKRDKDRILLYAEIDANRHSASNLNLVFIHNPELISSISRLSAQEWFSQRRKLLRKHPKALSVVASQIQPGAKLHLKHFTKRQKQAAMIVVFSSYRSEGEHKVIIKPKDINYVYFMKNHFIAK